MSYFKAKEFKVFKTWIHIGWNLKRLAVGFSIDRFSFNLDLGPFWFGIEW